MSKALGLRLGRLEPQIKTPQQDDHPEIDWSRLPAGAIKEIEDAAGRFPPINGTVDLSKVSRETLRDLMKLFDEARGKTPMVEPIDPNYWVYMEGNRRRRAARGEPVRWEGLPA